MFLSPTYIRSFLYYTRLMHMIFLMWVWQTDQDHKQSAKGDVPLVFNQTFFWMLPVNNHTKVCLLELWNVKLKKRLKFNIVANRKMKNYQYLTNG